MPEPCALMPDWHRCHVAHVRDGDTVRVHLSLGLGIDMPQQPLRLLGIQSWELRGPHRLQAQQARRRLAQMTQGHQLYLYTPGSPQDAWGRWLGWLWRPESHWLLNVQRMMIDQGLAWEWWPDWYRGPRRIPPAAVRMPDLHRLMGYTP